MSVTGVEAPESPSFVTPDDGFEVSAFVSDFSTSPAGCAGVLVSLGVTNSVLVSLGWVDGASAFDSGAAGVSAFDSGTDGAGDSELGFETTG